ncbi:hypothetical protein R6G85_02505 [Actinotignum urinale]|uniref:hypothetical protein n=1 Tax=Actinotignum urinale TaxID=190146 RepID=UPI002A801174|nr:hypothetical protein [Actinotignum urinale]MDY5151359.1 hypothetical protein [Actinotignum urinale]
MEAMRQALFQIPERYWWTLNSRAKQKTIADMKRGIRRWAKKALKQGSLSPVKTPVHIIAGISDYVPRGSGGNSLAIYDSENAHPVVKTIIDTLVSEKILVDDNPQVVESVSFTRLRARPPKGMHYVHFVLIPARETVYDLVLKGRNK